MASQINILPVTFVTDASFAGATGKFVKQTSTANTVSVCNNQYDAPIGVVSGETVPTAAGEAVAIQLEGVARVLAGGSITAGTLIGTDGSGKAVAKAVIPANPDLGEWVRGIALESASADEFVTVYLVTLFKVQ